MKIDIIKIDTNSFMVHSHIIGNDEVFLVQPVHIGCEWTRENSIFRSSLWDSEGNLISPSWKKFPNWGEKPAVFPVPESISGCKFLLKEDGSTLICSLYKFNFIFRTRGTVDARSMNNGWEIDVILEKYPKIRKYLAGHSENGTCPFSLIFEWVSSENVIVLMYDNCPDVILTGIINHYDYSYATQDFIDLVASGLKVKRPNYYSFDSLHDALEKIPSMDGIEGFCVYHSNDQLIHKLKTEQYQKMHRFKSNANIDTVLDLFFTLQKPSQEEFEKKLTEQFDHECFIMVKGFTVTICEAWDAVNKFIHTIQESVCKLSGMSRKDAAMKIIELYGPSDNTSTAFNILTGKTISEDHLKKLINKHISCKLN